MVVKAEHNKVSYCTAFHALAIQLSGPHSSHRAPTVQGSDKPVRTDADGSYPRIVNSSVWMIGTAATPRLFTCPLIPFEGITCPIEI